MSSTPGVVMPWPRSMHWYQAIAAARRRISAPERPVFGSGATTTPRGANDARDANHRNLTEVSRARNQGTRASAATRGRAAAKICDCHRGRIVEFDPQLGREVRVLRLPERGTSSVWMRHTRQGVGARSDGV